MEQIPKAYKDGVPPGVVLMDAGYGVNTALREGVTALGLSYVAGIQPQTSVWKEGEGPLPPKSFSGNGRPPKLMRRDEEHRPLSVKELAFFQQKRSNLPCGGFGSVTTAFVITSLACMSVTFPFKSLVDDVIAAVDVKCVPGDQPATPRGRGKLSRSRRPSRSPSRAGSFASRPLAAAGRVR